MDGHGRQSRSGHVVLSIVLAAAMSVVAPDAQDVAAAPVGEGTGGRVVDTPVPDTALDTARYVAVSPTRVHDSRLGDHVPDARTTFTVDPLSHGVLAATGLDTDDVTAVVVNVTTINATGPGYVTVYPHGTQRPATSTVNYMSPTHVNANLATSRVGIGGRLDVFSLTATDVVIDVEGVFVRSGSTRTGRHEPLDPRRVLDTRKGHALSANEPRTIDVSHLGVPHDATAAVVSLAAVNTSAPGYFTAWPAEEDRPTASNLNFADAGSIVSNGAIVAIRKGRFQLVSSADADAIVDVTGYITGDGAPESVAGLFVATEPKRLVDSRGGPMAYARSTTPFTLAGEGPIPESGVGSVAVNVTVTSMDRSGFVTALASGMPYDSATSTVNVGPGVGTASTAAIVRLGAAAGGIGLFASTDTHVIIDVSGYFVGTADPRSDPRHLTRVPPPAPPVDDDFTLLHRGDNLPPGYQGHVEHSGHRYVGWHPCRPIRYIVHDRLATPGALAVLEETIAATAAATGLAFVRLGSASDLIVPEPTDLGTFSQAIDAELLIGFSTPAETPSLSGSTKGFGGIGWHAGPYRVEGHTVYHRDGGMVAVDIAELRDPNALKAVLMHELAHVIGLGHSADGGDEVMTDTVAATPKTTFGLGDLNGLRLLGSVGCVR